MYQQNTKTELRLTTLARMPLDAYFQPCPHELEPFLALTAERTGVQLTSGSLMGLAACLLRSFPGEANLLQAFAEPFACLWYAVSDGEPVADSPLYQAWDIPLKGYTDALTTAAQSPVGWRFEQVLPRYGFSAEGPVALLLGELAAAPDRSYRFLWELLVYGPALLWELLPP